MQLKSRVEAELMIAVDRRCECEYESESESKGSRREEMKRSMFDVGREGREGKADAVLKWSWWWW